MIRYLTDTSEEIIRKYYDAYIYNLGEFSKAFKCEWIHPKDILMKEGPKSWYVCKDQHLLDTVDDNLALAKDVLENGTYWHVQVIEKDGGYHLKDGRHRVWSSKMLHARRRWPLGKRYLCMTNAVLDDSVSLQMYLPCLVDEVFKSGFPRPFDRAGQAIYDNDLIMVDVPLYLAVEYVVMFPRLLRDAMYHNPQIKPSIILNSEEAWKDFINKR